MVEEERKERPGCSARQQESWADEKGACQRKRKEREGLVKIRKGWEGLSQAYGMSTH